MALHEWNMAFEAGAEGAVPPEAWDMWLWQMDMHAPVTAQVMLNGMHLLGLLIARYRARHCPGTMEVRLQSQWPNFVHGGTVVRDLTVRQLRDAVEDLQLHFADYAADWEHVGTALDALMARFGALNLAAPDPGALDDVASQDPERPGRLSLPFIRRTTATLCVLYRHVHLASVAMEVPECVADPSVENCHVQAGLDAFYKHAMHADLPPCARIVYRQDFAGMYNCVTQVVYFHFPAYQRQRQRPLDDIRAGTCPLHCLSVALELQPDLPVVYEDDNPPGWCWMLLAGGALYLLAPSRAAYTGPCLWSLLARFRAEAQ